MKSVLELVAITVLAFVASQPANAQQGNYGQGNGAQDSGGDTIVVEGDRVEPRQVRALTRDITHPVATNDEPLARFQRPICVGISGMEEAVARAVIDRIYANALRAGVDINETDGCQANVWAIVVDDPAAIFERLWDEDSFLVRHLSRDDAQRVREQQGPARAWNITSVRSQDGIIVSLGDERNSGIPVNATTNMSRLVSAVRLDIEKSVVLIDPSALLGMDTHAVGDYVTMRVLARTFEPADDSQVDTILTLFSHGGPERLTEFDIAYLQNIYSTSATRPARQVRGRVSGLMESESD